VSLQQHTTMYYITFAVAQSDELRNYFAQLPRCRTNAKHEQGTKRKRKSTLNSFGRQPAFEMR